MILFTSCGRHQRARTSGGTPAMSFFAPLTSPEMLPGFLRASIASLLRVCRDSLRGVDDTPEEAGGTGGSVLTSRPRATGAFVIPLAFTRPIGQALHTFDPGYGEIIHLIAAISTGSMFVFLLEFLHDTHRTAFLAQDGSRRLIIQLITTRALPVWCGKGEPWEAVTLLLSRKPSCRPVLPLPAGIQAPYLAGHPADLRERPCHDTSR